MIPVRSDSLVGEQQEDEYGYRTAVPGSQERDWLLGSPETADQLLEAEALGEEAWVFLPRTQTEAEGGFFSVDVKTRPRAGT